MPTRPSDPVDITELIARVRPCVSDSATAALLVRALLELEERRRAASPEVDQALAILRTSKRLAAQGVPRAARVKALQGRFRISRASAYRKDAVSALETKRE